MSVLAQRGRRTRRGGLTGKPVLNGGKVGRGRGLPRLEGVEGPPAVYGDRQAGGAADSLLTGGHHSVDIPGIKLDLLAGHTAHAVDDDEGLRGDFPDQLSQTRELAQDAGGGVDVGDGDDLVLLALQGGLDIGQLRTATDGGGLKHVDVRAVGPQAVGEPITEIASAQDESVLAGFEQVGGDDIPA